MEDDTIEVYSFPLRHRIECHGYLFVEKPRPLSIRRDRIAQYNLLPSEIIRLKKGLPAERADGSVIRPEEVCLAPMPLRSYAYCSDTAYSEPLAEWIRHVSLVYHESTFLESERKRAKETFHSTASQAAQIAALAGAGGLILGHFSSRYEETERFAEEAAPYFPLAVVAEEGKTYPVPHIHFPENGNDQMIST
jgi:ribonuclease Z